MIYFTAHPPPRPGGRADTCKTHARAPPCATSRFSLPADSLNLPFLWPVSLFLLQPQIPFLTAPSRGATSKGWPQIAACCSFQCQDRCLLLHPGGCQCHSGASGAYCWQQNREWGPIEGHTAQNTAEVLYTSLFFCYTKLFLCYITWYLASLKNLWRFPPALCCYIAKQMVYRILFQCGI